MTTVVVDCNSVCHRVKHTLSDLSYREQKVGIIFGFLRQIPMLSKRLNSHRFVFCWDSKDSLRRKMYPEYKANRRKDLTDEEKELNALAYEQFDILRQDLLPSIGFRNVFFDSGFESDDLIASVVKNNDGKFVIVSTDTDLFQLLSNKVSMLIDSKKPLVTENSFLLNYRVLPTQWAEVKSIAGCSTDNVSGVVGVGEKTAVKYLLSELKSSSKAYQKIIVSDTLIARNRKLVTLPLAGTKPFRLRNERLSFDNFLSICNEYGFYSLTSNDSLKFWRKFLNCNG